VALFVHWIYGVEQVLVLKHYGARLYVRINRERRELGCPLQLRIAGPEAFDVYPDPSTSKLYYIWHKGEMLTLWVGYPSEKVKRHDKAGIQVQLTSGPEWTWSKVAPTDDDWPDWDDYRPQGESQPKEFEDDQRRDQAGRG
jgi:hypothetical protein